MIIDYEKNSRLYYNLHPWLEEGFHFIDYLKDKSAGRYERGEMYAFVQEGETKPIENQKIEAHKNYIDVQYMAEGSEVMEWKNISSLKETVPYDEEKDIAFYEGKGDACQILPGLFYIMFPEDGHKPCGDTGKRMHYRKIVLKIKC